MNRQRRTFLAASGALAAAGLLKPGFAQTQAWNKPGFESKAVAEALKALGASGAVASRDIVITAPDIAENGAVVPIAVTSRIPNTQQISIIADKNPFPLAASMNLLPGSDPYVSLRIKMGQTSDVRAVVKADGKYFVAVKEVKVTVGGCG